MEKITPNESLWRYTIYSGKPKKNTSVKNACERREANIHCACRKGASLLKWYRMAQNSTTQASVAPRTKEKAIKSTNGCNSLLLPNTIGSDPIITAKMTNKWCIQISREISGMKASS